MCVEPGHPCDPIDDPGHSTDIAAAALSPHGHDLGQLGAEAQGDGDTLGRGEEEGWG